ncbi:MAG: SBBP repeat-containing protein, partial [Nitrospiraceae bacterium]
MRSWKSLLLLFALAVAAEPAEANPRALASGNTAIIFEANQGQTDPLVKFVARGQNYDLFLTTSEMVLRLSKPDEAGPAVVRMRLLGANPRPDVSGVEKLPGKVNYFIGDDPARWRTNIPTYARVRYRSVYPGVDLVYYGNQ